MISSSLKGLGRECRNILQKYSQKSPVKLGSLAKELNVKIKVSNMPMGISGQIKREDGEYVIRINRYEKRERQRFTIAHELAHYLLHRELIDRSPNGIQDNVLYRSGQPIEIEYEANRLAADIVMPRSLVEEKFDALSREGLSDEDLIKQMASEFQVSLTAMEIRLSNIHTL
ncbi:MAG: ImmA/IrrE family metallo-endopeptidase [Gammaproteobacteria bacterium AqS3]|nr:ImmA/IrrE family metallo-endopeptidase [Gammaproteobacteria bacterium AqS3]